MATSQKLNDHFLTCTVCMDLFSDPVTLQCYHTFCRNCVISFTKSQPEAVAAKSIPCPCCRRWMKTPNPVRQVEEWMTGMKPSFLIQGLMDSFGPGSKDTNCCSYCKSEGKNTQATVWCSVCDDSLCEHCVKAHNQIPHFRKHDVADLSGDVKVTRKRKVMCKQHPREQVELVCKDCKKAVCHKCCTIYHRKCDSVVTIESELSSMMSTLERSRKKLDNKKDELKLRAQNRKSQLAGMTKMYLQAESDIKAEGQKARDVITLKEKKCLDELKAITDKHTGQLKVDIKTTEMAIQMYRQQSELIDQAVESDCEIDIYEMYQPCESGVLDFVGDTDPRDSTSVSRITFRKNTRKLTNVLNDVQLGEIDVMYEGGIDLKTTPVLIDTIDMSVAGDRYGACLADVAVLDVNGIDTVVVTNNNNTMVKSFYSSDNKLNHSKVSLDGNPWGITKLTHNQLAITVPSSRQIVTVEVNPDLKLLSTIQTSKQCRGIAVLTPSTFVVSNLSHPAGVDILDIAGNVIRSLTQNISSRISLKYPNYLCTTGKGNILVSDHGTKIVLCLTPQGDVVFNYSPTEDTELKCPLGITVTTRGDILVTDFYGRRVLHLTESGQFVKHILTSQDGLSNPRGLCMYTHGQMYVTLDNNTYKVFTFSG